MVDDISHVYQLDECLEWIIGNKFIRVVLQFNTEDLPHSVAVVHYLKNCHGRKNPTEKPLDLYVTQANTCCVDLIVVQHVSNVDAIVHFGKACLSKPWLENQDSEIPILFVFGHLKSDSFEANAQKIANEIESVKSVTSNHPICILYDPNLADYAKAICDRLSSGNSDKQVEVARLIYPSTSWQTTPSHKSLAVHSYEHSLGQYGLSKPLADYSSAIYLGDRLSIYISLQGPGSLWKIDCHEKFEKEQINLSRTLNKRMALVDRLRDDEELKVGVIFTNPLPNIGETMQRLEKFARARNHTLYFISMIQTIDECKIGNFDLCDAFVVVNSCTCSTILETLCFNRPIINDLEFELACGFEAVYGHVLWPRADSHLTVDDMINKRKVSDVSLALIHSRNEILERCSTARTNKWSGMDYKAATGPSGDDEGTSGTVGSESLTIAEGLHGIASSYVSEPLKKMPPSDTSDDGAFGGGRNDGIGDGSGNQIPDIDGLKIEK